MNYTIKISQLDATTSAVNLTLSAVSAVPGVALTVSPKELTFVGTQQLLTLGISLAPTVNSSTLPVEIIASSAGGATNATFDFSVNKSLVVVTPLGALAPSTLHVGVGQTVTWLNFMGTQQGDPVVANVALVDGSAASPTMFLNDVWSHTFDKPGAYPYQVTLTGTPTASGEVIVE
jgi:plastocyanin